jgi:hypothetical protein
MTFLALVSVNGTPISLTGPTGYDATSGSTITIALLTPGSQWSINCTSADQYNPASTVAAVQATKIQNFSTNTCAFTVPVRDGYFGAALQFTSTINNDPSSTFTFGVFVLCTNGVRGVFPGETNESNATTGMSGDWNNLVALSTQGEAGSTPQGPAGGDLSGNYPDPTVSGLQGRVVASSAPATSQVLTWNGSQWAPANAAGGTTLTTQVTGLHAVIPSSLNQTVFVDGYAAANDCGGAASGYFVWNHAYTGPISPINVYPDGYTTGAWSRVLPDSSLWVSYFGAQGDNSTDDTVAIQAALDAATAAQPVVLPPTSVIVNNAYSIYKTSQPLYLLDGISSATTLTGIVSSSPLAGIENLTGFMPLVLCGDYTPGPDYQQDAAGSGLWMIQYGSNGPANQKNPTYHFNDTPVNDLSGFTDFTLEFFFNPLNNTVYSNTHFAGDLAQTFITCGGTTLQDTHYTFNMSWSNEYEPGGNQLIFTLWTVNGQYTVNTGVTDGWQGTGTDGYLNHVAISYDGAHLRMFLNGQQADSSMTIAATGALNQQWYECISINSFGVDIWPQTNPTQSGTFVDQVQFGRFRFSNIARYTAPFTAPTWESVTADGNTQIYMDFAPANRPARASASSWITFQSPITYNVPIWISSQLQLTYTDDATRVSNLLFTGFGCGIRSNSTLGSTYGANCTFQGLCQGIFVDNFSYNNIIEQNCDFQSMNSNASSRYNFHSFDVYFGGGSQFSAVEDNCNSGNGRTNWHIVCANADIKIGTGFINSMIKGAYAFPNNAGVVLFDGSNILDDESTGYGVCGVLLNSTYGQPTLIWNGGYIGMSNSTVPIFLIQGNSTVNVNTIIFGNPNPTQTPLFSFFNATASGAPVFFTGQNYYSNPLVDPANPGPAIIPAQQGFGLHTLDVSALDGYGGYTDGYSLALNDFFWSNINITDTTHLLSTDGYLVLPFNQFCYSRTFTNSTLQPLTFIGTSGTGIQIASEKSASLRCDGLGNWKRLTPDT